MFHGCCHEHPDAHSMTDQAARWFLSRAVPVRDSELLIHLGGGGVGAAGYPLGAAPTPPPREKFGGAASPSKPPPWDVKIPYALIQGRKSDHRGRMTTASVIAVA